MQLITIGVSRTIMLWDTLKLECIQVIKDASPQSRFYSSTCFNSERGVLMTACINIKVWHATVDPQVKFESIQRQAITKNALKEQVSRIEKEIQQIDLDQTRHSKSQFKDII